LFAIADELAAILSTVRRPGDFFVSGSQLLHAPRIEIAGVGVVSLPLPAEQARQLVAVAARAPYGRGSETLVDTDVRRTWQIDAGQVGISGRHWPATLAEIVARCADGLGIQESVSAEFYKLLIYDTGSFFVNHRDTEKAPGMFATLVIVLPSPYTGGELVVRHRQREVSLDLSGDDAAEARFAAFYADCRHELRPVTSGFRLALVYNLIRSGPGAPPTPPEYDQQIASASQLLGRWAKATESDVQTVGRLVYPLEHAYTLAEIAFPTLKGGDAAVARALTAACRPAGCRVQPALLSIHESGSAEPSKRWSRRGRHYSDGDDDYTVSEVCERSLTLSDLQDSDGSRADFPEMACDDADLCPPGVLDDEEPDEEEFFEATGNAGASFERSYRRAALVVWPQASELRLFADAGCDRSLPYLRRLSERWLAGAGDTDSAEWQRMHELARLIIARKEDWRVPPWLRTSSPGKASELLAILTRIADHAGIADFLTLAGTPDHYPHGDNAAISAAAMSLAPPLAAELVTRIVAGNASSKPAASAELLAGIAAGFAARLPDGSAGTLLAAAGEALVAALPVGPVATPAGVWPARPSPILTPELIIDPLRAFFLLDSPALAERALDRLLASPRSFADDETLIAAAVSLLEDETPVGDWRPVQRLVAACVAELSRRSSEPLAPPADFARASDVGCSCEHCRQLAVFLADGRRAQWAFRAHARDRAHVETSIRNRHCDVDCETIRSGSPHTLLCTKNLASYERWVVQRQRDLANLTRLQHTR